MHQAVAGEIVFNRLIERLMVIVVEHAGAVRGLVLLPKDGEMQVVAEAVTGRNSVTVHLRHQVGRSGGVAAIGAQLRGAYSRLRDRG
jgi:hypothetical protein